MNNINYNDIVYPTTEENRFRKGSVNVPVGYHNNLVEHHIDYIRMEKLYNEMKKNYNEMKEKISRRLTWKQRITGVF